MHQPYFINGIFCLGIFGCSIATLQACIVDYTTVTIRSTPISLLHPAQVLRIHLSSEEDLFLLHTLEFSEEEFQALKAEQGILVDFGNFPGKIIGLLERCIASSREEAPRSDTCYPHLKNVRPLLCLN